MIELLCSGSITRIKSWAAPMAEVHCRATCPSRDRPSSAAAAAAAGSAALSFIADRPAEAHRTSGNSRAKARSPTGERQILPTQTTSTEPIRMCYNDCAFRAALIEVEVTDSVGSSDEIKAFHLLIGAVVT